jgi:uncharacterized protein (DUF2236 family)
MRTVSEHRQFLEHLAAKVDNPQAGFFGPKSMAWRVSREMLMGLVVSRALLMQVAHPKVAQGVADHSDFSQKPFARAFATLKAQQVIVFGSCEQSIEALMRIYGRHVSVRGEVAGEPDAKYQANDPTLLFWVYATLFDSMLYAYRTFLPNLPAADSARFYEEGKLFASLIGISPDLVPHRLIDFDGYMQSMLTSGEVRVTAAGRQIGNGLMDVPNKLARPFNEFLAAGTMPASLRTGFGLRWGPRRQAVFDALARLTRFIARFTPQALHTSPVYWLALHRVRSVA